MGRHRGGYVEGRRFPHPTTRPTRVLGVEQHGGEDQPPLCPKCHALWHEASYWECRCFCGFIWYRTTGTHER